MEEFTRVCDCCIGGKGGGDGGAKAKGLLEQQQQKGELSGWKPFVLVCHRYLQLLD